MNRPENLSVYDELDLKLGIKSSLPHVKGTIALAILLWECADRPAELIYSQQNGDSIVLTDELNQWLVDALSEICEEEQIGFEALMAGINENQLFKSQMEALIVAFELVWKLAKVSFVEDGKAASAERTGGTRYPKKLLYTVNADIIHSLIDSNYDAYIRVLLSWIGFNINVDPECEQHMLHLLTALSEEAVFKLTDGNRDVIFNQDSVYTKLLETEDVVDINGDSEAKGSLRVLKSLLSDGMNPYLSYSRGNVSVVREKRSSLEAYQKRVDMFLRLSATKVIGLEDIDAEDEGFSPENYEENRISTGCNVLLYGVPGSGKSWTIEHEYCKPESVVERLVFHPDYTYSDFIGQILPAVAEDGQVSYKFTPGPFTNILREAYNNPGKEYILIIEEINRGNAPAIFGEVFQLLDRKVEIRDIDDDGYPIGTSEYGITNMNIAEEMYGKDRKTEKVRIPSNLSIIGTMNTSDQNVFTLLAINKFAAPQTVDFPINAYKSVIEYYFSIGGTYYVEKEQVYITAPTGKQDWARTARKQMPLVQSRNGVSSFVFTQFEVRSSTPNDTKEITQINRFCVYEAFKRLGWLYVPYMPEEPGPQ